MPLDVVRRLLTPLRKPTATSRYPDAPPLLQPAARGLPGRSIPQRCERDGRLRGRMPHRRDRRLADAQAVHRRGALRLLHRVRPRLPERRHPDWDRERRAGRRAGRESRRDRPEPRGPRQEPGTSGRSPCRPRSASGRRSLGRLRAVAARPPPRRRIVQRLRLGDRRAAQPVPRRPAPGHRLRGLAPPRRPAPGDRGHDPEPGGGGAADLRGDAGASARGGRRRVRDQRRSLRRLVRRVATGPGTRCRSTSTCPGCPPRPEAIIEGMLQAVDRLERSHPRLRAE